MNRELKFLIGLILPLFCTSIMLLIASISINSRTKAQSELLLVIEEDTEATLTVVDDLRYRYDVDKYGIEVAQKAKLRRVLNRIAKQNKKENK